VEKMFFNRRHEEVEDEIFCFSMSEFEQENFDAAEFVTSHRPKVENLETLKIELEEFLISLKEEIQTIIHDEYHDFITFSSSLGGIQQILNKIKNEYPKIFSESFVS
jgi:hypothetical protein